MQKVFCQLFFFLSFCLSLYAQLSPNGLQFDGIDDQVMMASPTAFDVNAGDFTIEAFIRDESTITSGYSEEVILSNESTNPNSPGCRVSILWGALSISINGNGTSFQYNSDLRDHQCHHVAIVRNNGTVQGYIDGEPATSYYIPDSLHSFFPLRLGAWGGIAGPYAGFFKGMIKEVRLWNSARTWAEITNSKMSALSPPLNPALVAYWRCNEGSGTTINDFVSLNNGMLGGSMPGSEPVWVAGCTDCIPHPVISAAGPLTFCPGGQVLLQTSPGAGYYSYQWKRNNVNLPNWSSPDNAVTASGSYTVEVYNSCGTSLSAPVQVNVNALPSATITASGATTFCQGGSVTLNVPVLPNRSYQWKKNGVVIPGATSSAYVATSGGTYKAIVTNTNTGCSKTTGTGTTVSVNSNPTVSSTPQGPTTFCAGDSVQLKASYHSSWLYQWKKNNMNINGATSNKIYAKTAGNYKVKVTNANGCTALSSPVQISVPCREEIFPQQSDSYWLAYPNPSRDHFYFRLINESETPFSIKIIDYTGALLESVEAGSAEWDWNASGVSAGIYEAIITNGNQKQLIRLIKE